ncbi:MAG: hypothetical protein GEU73_15110 [Chloroflexi bacterium]|nr:hypothetical protein [Chloroflexota bacterium]
MQELPDLVDTLYVLSEDGELAARGTPSEVFAQHELLLRCNLEPPPLVRLLAALEQRGEHLPVSNDPEAVADALLAWRNRKVESRPLFPVPNIGRGSERDPG